MNPGCSRHGVVLIPSNDVDSHVVKPLLRQQQSLRQCPGTLLWYYYVNDLALEIGMATSMVAGDVNRRHCFVLFVF